MLLMNNLPMYMFKYIYCGFVFFYRVEDVETVDVYTAKGLLSIGHRYVDVR